MPKLFIFFSCLCTVLLCSTTAYSQHSDNTPKVIIIIDDVGNNLELGLRAANLPGPIHLAILPQRGFSKQLASQGHRAGQEIMLHAPMANIGGKRLGHGGLTPDMSREQLVATLEDSLTAIPHIKGVNNHMGSLLTTQAEPMSWVMATLQKHQLYFVDSRTSAGTVAQQIAQNFKLPNAQRDVFLDNQRNEASISQQFELLLQKAKQQGVAVGIGHPYPETLKVLEQKLPSMALRGFQLSTISSTLTPAKPRCTPSKGYRFLFEPECQLQLAAHSKDSKTSSN